jgi:hypothetical protein
MIGAILLTAAFAFLSSTIATIGNFAISRDFSDYEWDQDSDILLDSAIRVRFVQYRMAANIFYRQALVLWSLLAILLAYKLLFGI